MVLWKRVTLGELGVIVTMVVSLLLFLVKVGEWKATVERSQADYAVSTQELKREVKALNRKVDEVSQQDEDDVNRLSNRMMRLEMKITKGLGLPPYGSGNPPPIIKYLHKGESPDD